MLNVKIQDYLANLDRDVSPLLSFHGENKIADGIRDIIKAEGPSYTPADEDVAERIAFDFLAEYPDSDSGWGTYYGPIYVLPNGSGQMVEYPSIQGITETTLTYWATRAFAVKNPLLSSRYADLVIDFSPKVLSKSADYKLIQLVVDCKVAGNFDPPVAANFDPPKSKRYPVRNKTNSSRQEGGHDERKTDKRSTHDAARRPADT